MRLLKTENITENNTWAQEKLTSHVGGLKLVPTAAQEPYSI